jgi:hypothetical protein
MWSLILFSPLIFILLLFISRSKKIYRFFSLAVIFFTFISFMWILMFHWVFPTFIEKGTILEERGMSVRNVFVRPLAYFLGSEWLVVLYMAFVIVSGFAAHSYAKKKIRARNS